MGGCRPVFGLDSRALSLVCDQPRMALQEGVTLCFSSEAPGMRDERCRRVNLLKQREIDLNRPPEALIECCCRCAFG